LDFIPAAIPAIALLLREAPGAVRLAATAVLGLQWALAAAFVWLRPPWSLGGKRSSFFAAIDSHHGPPLDHYMPSFTPYTALVQHSWRLAAWVLAAGLFLAYGAVLARRPGSG
jgi:hypothetical protein